MFLLLGFLIPLLGVTGTIWLLIFLSIPAYMFFKIKRKQSFWKTKGVNYIKPKFLLGSMEIIRSKSIDKISQDIYNAYPEGRYHGAYQFTAPLLVVKDPDLIKLITIKEFDHFINHREFASVDTDAFWSKNLFASRDERWRDLRATLSPSFTNSKMRTMFVLINECARQFVDFFEKENKDVVELEVKDGLSRYTNDVIATTAFGLKCDSLKERNNDFYTMGKEATNFTGLRILKFFFYGVSPTLARLFRIKIIPPHIASYFSKIIEETVQTRKEKNIFRPDMIHLLMEAQKGRQHHEEDSKISEGFSSVSDFEMTKNRQKREITLGDINSQAFIFFLAGFETVSTLLTFTFYELAINPDVQDRLRDEINTIDEEVTYESVLGLKYLDMVVSEALRKWPPVAITDRQVTKDFTIKPKDPEERPLHLEKGVICWFAIFAIHHDPKFYPNPLKFDPERFSEENKLKINPSVYLPFGAGPRNCIGSRFALLESKLIIVYILRSFKIVPMKKTQIPVKLVKNSATLSVEGGMWLGLERIRK